MRVRHFLARSRLARFPFGFARHSSSSASAGEEPRPKRLGAAVLDWSGTCADNYVIAPAYAFVEAFAAFGVDITMEEARGPMGLRKDLHIAALCKDEKIAQRWKAKHGRLPTPQDEQELFQRFVPMQLECLPKFTTLVPGTAEAVKTLRRDFNLKVGNSTGFQRVMVDVLLKAAAQQGYVPDCSVAGDEVERPRPFPDMVLKNMKLLGVSDASTVVKVDDTCGGVGEGLNAGTWTIGLSHTSTYMNINSFEERLSMSEREFDARGRKSAQLLREAGPDYVVPDISHVPYIVYQINARLARGERPRAARRQGASSN